MFKLIRNLIYLAIAIAAGLAYCSYRVEEFASPYCYDSIDRLPENHTGLILGTSAKRSDGGPNLYLKYRLEAAVLLFKSGKIKKILISGDNRTKNYNEPETIRRLLQDMGIPDSVMVLDYAGFRTFDSVIRANKVFGLTQLTIISQYFHNERAIFIARQNNIEAVAFNARNVEGRSGLNKTLLREYLARALLFIDLYVIGREPKFLGEPIDIP